MYSSYIYTPSSLKEPEPESDSGPESDDQIISDTQQVPDQQEQPQLPPRPPPTIIESVDSDVSVSSTSSESESSSEESGSDEEGQNKVIKKDEGGPVISKSQKKKIKKKEKKRKIQKVERNSKINSDGNNEDGKALTKNQKRKLKKKRRKLEIKADEESGNAEQKGKARNSEALEFTYDPTLPKPEEPAKAPPVPEPEEGVKPSRRKKQQPPPPKKPAFDEITIVDPNALKYKDFVLQFRQPSTLPKEQELKVFWKAVLNEFKKSGNYVDKEEAKWMHLTEMYCGKLFHFLDKKELPKEAMNGLQVIKRKLVMQEYDEAQAEYYSVSIGKSPWPTMDGARNILEDDEKRKTMQAIKRLMTFFQKHIAPVQIPANPLDRV